jgi:hypothetical protein
MPGRRLVERPRRRALTARQRLRAHRELPSHGTEPKSKAPQRKHHRRCTFRAMTHQLARGMMETAGGLLSSDCNHRRLTTIVVPGSFTSGTNHFANAGRPADEQRAAQYEALYGGMMESVAGRLAELAPEDADASQVSEEIARIVALPYGARPFRSHVDPADDGSEVVSAVADRIRAEFLARIGLEDLL